MSNEQLLHKIKRFNQLSKFDKDKENLRKEIEQEIATRQQDKPAYYLVA